MGIFLKNEFWQKLAGICSRGEAPGILRKPFSQSCTDDSVPGVLNRVSHDRTNIQCDDLAVGLVYLRKRYWESLNSLDLRNGGVALYLENFKRLNCYLSGTA